jgi:hypothetical protein
MHLFLTKKLTICIYFAHRLECNTFRKSCELIPENECFETLIRFNLI